DNSARAAPRIVPHARLRRRRAGPWRERPCVLSPVPNRNWSAHARILCCPRSENSLRPKRILRRLTIEDDRARFAFLDPPSEAGYRFCALHRPCSPEAVERSDGPDPEHMEPVPNGSGGSIRLHLPHRLSHDLHPVCKTPPEISSAIEMQ